MSDLLHILEPMEQATKAMLQEAFPPDYSSAESEASGPLNGALPLVEELVNPVTRCLITTEEHARAAELHLEDAATGLISWRDRVTSLRSTLAKSLSGAV
jgi:hypothetical protein